MQPERFRHLVTAKGPFASIYFEDSHDTEDAAAQLELKWRAIREQLEEQGLGSELIATAEGAIVGVHPPVGRSGRGVVVGVDGVLLDEHLVGAAPTTVVRVSELPYIVPVVEFGADQPTYVLVAVDHAGADLTLCRHSTARSESVDGGGYPVHKAGGAETSGYGTPGYADPQRRTEEQGRKNIRAVAERIGEVVEGSGADVVFVLGEVRSRADLLSALPERVADRAVELAVGARHSGVDDHAVRQAIDAEFARRRDTVLDDVAQRFAAEFGSGRAVAGLPDVCRALRQGAVDTLIIGDLGDATVVDDDDLANVAPDADALSDMGSAPTRTLRADEALPLLAVSVDASLVRIDDRIAPADGLAALLRYAPTG